MKILIISQYFWPESFRINDLASSMQVKGHDVTVLTGLPNYPSGKLFEGYSLFSFGKDDYQGVKVFRVPIFIRRQGKSWQLALNYISFVIFSCLVGPFFCKNKYDLIFVFEPSPFTVGIPGILFRRWKNAPLIFWVQDLWPESLTATGAVNSKKILGCVAAMVRMIYKRCDRVLIQSRSFLEPVIAAGALPDRIHYFPNWAEDIFKPVEIEKNNPVIDEIPNGFCIMFAGNLGVAQSLDTIVLAANILKEYDDIHWVILGDGRYEDNLRELISRHLLENKIHLLGRRSLESMPDYFSLSDVMLVTLRKNPIFALTIPSKVQSYLACGRPIVGALDGEGANIINESKAGFAVPAENPEALAKSVLDIYKMTDEDRKMMGRNARSYYEKHFERDRLIKNLEKLMIETIEEGLCES